MNNTEFVEMAKNRVEKCLEILNIKKDEYARNENRLNNFYRAGEIQRITPEKALLGMLSKHLVSIIDIVEDIDKGIMPSQEILDSKIGDAINYHVLLQALITERIKNQKQEVSNGRS